MVIEEQSLSNESCQNATHFAKATILNIVQHSMEHFQWINIQLYYLRKLNANAYVLFVLESLVFENLLKLKLFPIEIAMIILICVWKIVRFTDLKQNI